MPPEERFVPRFAAEPPQEELPYGRWAGAAARGVPRGRAARSTRRARSSASRARSLWYPGPHAGTGARYVPATSLDRERLRAVRLRALRARAGEDGEPSDFSAHVDFTEETAERNPDWQLDLCDEVIGAGAGSSAQSAAMTLVWGRPLVSGGRIVTAELAELAVDQCELVERALHADRARRLPPRPARDQAVRRQGPGARARVAVRGRGRGRER